jgi:hypothetical protein
MKNLRDKDVITGLIVYMIGYYDYILDLINDITIYGTVFTLILIWTKPILIGWNRKDGLYITIGWRST